MSKPTKEQVKAVLDEMEDSDLPDGAFWAAVHDRLSLKYGEVFSIIIEDPDFFGCTEVSE